MAHPNLAAPLEFTHMKTKPLAVSRSSSWLTCMVCLCLVANCWQAVSAQDLLNLKDPLGLSLSRRRSEATADPVVKITVTPPAAKPGETVTLSIAVELPEGSYTYSMNPSFGGGAKATIKVAAGVMALGEFEADHPPKKEFSKPLDQEIEKYLKKVTWTRKYRIAEGDGPARLQGVFNYQVCDASSCRMLNQAFDLTIPQAADQVAVQPIGRREDQPAAESATSTAAADDRFQLQAKLRTGNAKASIRLTPAGARPGDEVTLEAHVEMIPEWHTFAITQPEENAADPTEITVDVHDGLDPVDSEFTASKPFHVKELVDPLDANKKLIQQQYEEEVTWSRKFRLKPGTQLADVKVVGQLRFQICKEKGACIPNRVKFELPTGGSVPAATSAVATNDPLTPVAEPNPGDGKSDGGAASKTADPSGDDCLTQTSESDIRDRGVLYVLGTAFVFGWLALLTPCVFPMVPITVSFFLKQAEKKHNSPLSMALVYCGSIIATFTVLGLAFSALFGAASITTLANGVLLNLFLGIVLLFFALNLLGMFEIQIPSWLLTFTASKESTGSYLGVFFMALTFTLTSFTCTFAFLGLILVWAAKGDFWWPLGGLLSFATAFSLPFFLLALFPSYLHKLPKSGGWMNRVKVVMGLIEMAFMFKFLSVADISWNGSPAIFDYHLVMCAWMAIAIVTGMYLIGKIQLPHDTREDHVGVLPMVLAIGFFGLAGYLGVGIFGHEPPSGFIGRQIVAFAPPQLEGGSGEDGPFLIGSHDKQEYLLDFEKAKQKARKLQQPLFIDFTGVNCINCREMEAMMGQSSAIQQRLKNFVRVQLYTDRMPKNAVGNDKEGQELIDRNLTLQTDWYQNASLPGYAVVSPDGQVIFSRVSGKVPASDFETFLDCGLSKWKRGTQPELAASAAR